MPLYNEAPHLLNEWLVVDVDQTSGPAAKQLEHFQEGASGPGPVTGPFITSAIVRIAVDEHVDAAHNLVDGGASALRIILRDQDRRQPVRVDPWCPIVDHAWMKRHPPEVVSVKIGVQDPSLQLGANSGLNQR